MAKLQQIITLTQTQYNTIINGGTITVGDKNYTYDSNTLYMVPEVNPDIKYGTTSYWQSQTNYIPSAGEIIIYADKTSYIENNTVVNVPGIKIGDGLAYGIDLPFVNDDLQKEIFGHINNTVIHITTAERNRWNNKINCENTVDNETLIINRN